MIRPAVGETHLIDDAGAASVLCVLAVVALTCGCACCSTVAVVATTVGAELVTFHAEA